jgi:hypothetical protein
MPLVTQWYSIREFAIADPDGYVITFAERMSLAAFFLGDHAQQRIKARTGWKNPDTDDLRRQKRGNVSAGYL